MARLMKCVIQDFEKGKLSVEEIPLPIAPPGFVLVKNEYSFVSAGTERTIVNTAKASLVKKAAMRPDLVRQVLDNMRREGLSATVDKVKGRLSVQKALGYASAGRVVESRARFKSFRPGDAVACAGAEYAVHAEYVIVPENLCVPVPEGVDLQDACAATLGAIAMQGVRRSGVVLGETVAVIGLGILGLICCEILAAAGTRVMGVDVDPASVEKARSLGYTAFLRSEKGLDAQKRTFTRGFGFDAAIITASSPDNDPALLAEQLIRKRGRIVVVGAFKLDFERQPLYEKEGQVLMSTSYGPGRYDNEYEEKGLSYPIDLIRWGQRENIEGFLDMLARGQVRIRELISHRFPISQALAAYDLITGKVKEPYGGVLISYEKHAELPGKPIRPILPVVSPGEAGIGFIGAGNFAQGYLLPHLKKMKANLLAVTCKHPASAHSVAKRFRFREACSSHEELLARDDLNTVFITTRHDLHASLVVSAWKNRRHVYVEKPLCLNRSELEQIREIAASSEHLPLLMVGYNRRFAPASVFVRNRIEDFSPVVMTMTVNAGPLPDGHWLLDPEVGGGRVVGEFCHFIDLCEYFLGPIRDVSARGPPSPRGGAQDFSVMVKALKGMAAITYTAQGSPRYPKERLEFFTGEQVWVIDNYRRVLHSPSGRVKAFKGKGHEQEITAFLEGIRKGEAPIPLESLLRGMDFTLQVQEQLMGHRG